MSNLRQDFTWSDAVKPYPKKSKSMNQHKLNPFSISKDTIKFKLDESLDDEENCSKAFDHDQAKISMKDLCLEDKQRIANLIKELARYFFY